MATRTTSLAVLAFVAACASTRLPAPSSEASCVVAVRAHVEDPVRHAFAPPLAAEFALVPEGGDPARLPETLRSNHRRGDTLYLLDAPPGKYAVVALYEERDGKRIRTYLGEKCIRASLTEAPPGGTAFLGTLRVRTSTRTEEADAAQLHYFRRLDPELLYSGSFARAIGRNRAHLEVDHTLRRDAEETRAFLGRARGDLEDSPWTARLP